MKNKNMNRKFAMGLMCLSFTFLSQNLLAQVSLKYDLRRGSPAEYDPGAPANSKWLELYGSAPNYRALGVKLLKGTALTDEKFRWEFGPMWYRGRLTPESVKVFVVGQEGAQDENVSNRAFTGSTGTRVQKFLNHLGIYRSYLFMNTFVYTINGQLEDDPVFKWLEQGEGSPIVEYRHSLFDYMLETNSQTVALFMGVGSGGKASLATWVNARGGKCSVAYEMKNCDTTGMIAWFKNNKGLTIKNKILAIGVPHPGGANPNLGGTEQLENIKRGFTEAAQRVANYKSNDPKWLIPDIDEKSSTEELLARLNAPYIYKGYAPIPFRDFAFNTNWRMGSEGTTSNRWGASSIQVYSDEGVYNDKQSIYSRPRDLNSGLRKDGSGLFEMPARDLPYESPRYNPTVWTESNPSYDYGPCGYLNAGEKPCALAEALVSWPNLKQMGIPFISHESFGYFGSYRGSAKKAQIFILADQTSHDDFFSTRALTGASGQKLQSVLNLLDLENQYFILRTLPVDTLGVKTETLINGVTKNEMIEHYEKILNLVAQNGQLKSVIAVGPLAEQVLKKMKINSELQTYQITNMDDLDSVQAFIKQYSKDNNVAQELIYKGYLKSIPRRDLPYHTRWWMGSSGDRGGRGEQYSVGNYYRVWAPYWVSKLMPLPLTQSELSTLQQVVPTQLKSTVQLD